MKLINIKELFCQKCLISVEIGPSKINYNILLVIKKFKQNICLSGASLVLTFFQLAHELKY